jgi:hypothetical protein
VARAFEFIFRGEPARRATQMRALGEDRVNAGFLAHDPDSLILFIFFADFSHSIVSGEACFKSRRGLKQYPRKCRTEKAEQPQAAEYPEVIYLLTS